jgi:hypothetical protein
MLQVVGLLVRNQPSGCVLCGGSCGHAHEGVSSGHLSSPAGAGPFFKISCVISFRGLSFWARHKGSECVFVEGGACRLFCLSCGVAQPLHGQQLKAKAVANLLGVYPAPYLSVQHTTFDIQEGRGGGKRSK